MVGAMEPQCSSTPYIWISVMGAGRHGQGGTCPCLEKKKNVQQKSAMTEETGKMKYSKIIQLCQTYLCFELPSVLLKKELKNLERNTMNIIILATLYRYIDMQIS